MALEINPARGPKTVGLPTIPQEFINPKTGLADYWVVEEFEAAVKAAEESEEPFKAPRLRSGSPIDVRECIACGASMLPTMWPEKAAGDGEAIQEPDEVVPGLEDKTVPELKDLARDAGVTGYGSMNKAQLIEAIQE